MQKTLICIMVVTLMACGALEAPEELSREDGAEPAPWLRQQADQALDNGPTCGCPTGQYVIKYYCDPSPSCGSCEPYRNRAQCGTPDKEYSYTACGGTCDVYGWAPTGYNYSEGCNMTSSVEPLKDYNQSDCVNVTRVDSVRLCSRGVWNGERGCPQGLLMTRYEHDSSCDIQKDGTPEKNKLTCVSYLKSISLNGSRASITSPPLTGTISLNVSSPYSMWVHIASNSTGVTVSPVLVPANRTKAKFTVYVTKDVKVETPVTLTASLGVAERDVSLTVEPTPVMKSLSLSPMAVTSPAIVKGTAKLSFPATVGGLPFYLSSSSPHLVTLRPPSGVIPEGASSVNFEVEVKPTNVPAKVTIGAFAHGGAPSQELTIQPAPPPADAIDPSPGCRANSLSVFEPPPQVTLPFPINFFGTTYSRLFVNFDGNVSFLEPVSGQPPFLMSAESPPVIAPFLLGAYFLPWDDEDGIHYGVISFEGRRAFCVNWTNVFSPTTWNMDERNNFQLLLVDRSDVGAGDFDIVMNYNQIQWDLLLQTPKVHAQEAGLDGSDGSASVGYSAGNGQTYASYSMPGSMTRGSFLDTNLVQGLARTSHNSPVRGRHIFPVRRGSAPTNGRIMGTVTDDASPPRVLAGAMVQVCPAAVSRCAFVSRTDTQGHYTAAGLEEGIYTVKVFPPEDVFLWQDRAIAVPLETGASLEVDVTLKTLPGILQGTSIVPSKLGVGNVPSVYNENSLFLWTRGCQNGNASYRVVHSNGQTLVSGAMPEDEDGEGNYLARLPPLKVPGIARVEIRVQCPDGSEQSTVFGLNIYTDPSGKVSTLSGKPIHQARVTLYRADSPTGPFEEVPNGSAIMSPDNRMNWDLTDAEGRFRWDVIDGYYRVRAEHEGCLAASGVPYVESEVLTVPPAVTDLDLRLDCPGLEDTTPPVSTASLSTEPNAFGWHQAPVTIQLVAVDADSGVEAITYSLSGAQTEEATVPGSQAEVTVSAEGTTLLTWSARDGVGNEEAPQQLELRLDMTAPVLTCQASPSTLSPPNHKLVPVQVEVQVNDALSGAGPFVLKAVTSNEPDNGLGDGDAAGDLQQWESGTPDTQGQLRAERAGNGTGRVYTLSYEGQDQAGNVAACSAIVSVPHSVGR
jgi:hypothetical protein